jgi:hypothetical protein
LRGSDCPSRRFRLSETRPRVPPSSVVAEFRDERVATPTRRQNSGS